MNENYCFLVPIHPPKFNLAANLYLSYQLYYSENNFYFIFSNIHDLLNFNDKFPEIKNYKYIICEKFYGEGIINYKKLFALNYIFNYTNYKKAAVIDCDTIFIKKINYQKMFDKILKDKILYSTLSPDSYITQSCLRLFSEEKQKIILNKIKIDNANFLYFWFNQIPLYEKRKFNLMYKKLDLEKNIQELRWADFDYILYAYFLISENLIKIKKINYNTISLDSFLEQMSLITPDLLKYIKELNPLWMPKASNYSLLNKKDLKLFKNVFINFHLC